MSEKTKIDELKKGLPLYSGTYDSGLVAAIKEKLLADDLLPAPQYSANSISILKDRYFRKDENGVPQEDVRGMIARVSSFVALPEYVYSRGDMNKYYSTAKNFFELMAKREFMPNSPTLMNAARKLGMLSACFVLPIGDSIDSIFTAVRDTAQIQKAGGGTGFSFDNLRPTGDYVGSSGGTTSGPVSFWKVIAEATNAIQQGAFRRGANMGMMSTNHPDILRFINAKAEDGRFSNFNTSIKVSDSWMNDLLAHPESPLVVTNPRTGKSYHIPRNVNVDTYTIHDLIPTEKSPDNSSVYTKQMLWNIIIANAHRNGDPGIAFIDKMNAVNPTPKIGLFESTNPCGEQPLLPYEACNLGSINLGIMLNRGRPDFERLKKVARNATRFLDDVIDVNTFPKQEIIEMVSGNRKIGLGIMGWADMLAALRIRYDSEQAINLAEEIMSTVQQAAVAETEKLAEEKGVFPNFEKSIYAGGKPRRNATVTTIAPTGTISMIAGASSGIEPFFGNAYSHRDAEGTIRKFTNEVLRRDLEAVKVDADKVFEKLFAGASLAEIKEVPREIAKTYITSHEIDVERQVAMQAAFQRHTENAVSKTLNLNEDAPLESVDMAYKASFAAGCKGVTVYRNGSRYNQPIIFGKIPELIVNKRRKLAGTMESPMVVPDIMPAIRIRQDTPFGHIHANIVFDSSQDYKAVEAFALLGNAGSEEAATLEGYGRLASLHLRSGGNIETVVDQLIEIGSGIEKSTRSGHVKSLAMGFAKTLLKFVVARNYFSMGELLTGKVDYDVFSGEVADVIRTKEAKELLIGEGGNKIQDFLIPAQASKSNGKKTAFIERCPHCQSPLIPSEGCKKCPKDGCGYAKC